MRMDLFRLIIPFFFNLIPFSLCFTSFSVFFFFVLSSNKKKRLLVEDDNTSKIPSLQQKGTLAEDEELAMQLLSGF